MNIKSIICASCASLAAISISANAATLVIEADQLLGADNINVLGTNYDVRFVEGSCIAEFDNCTNFTFDTLDAANAANDALANQVLIGIYDSNPELTFGIEVFTTGQIFTPIRTDGFGDVLSSILYNAFTESADGLGVGGYGIGFDMSSSDRTFASWTVSQAQSPVPVPAAAWLFGSGLLGLVSVARRKKS